MKRRIVYTCLGMMLVMSVAAGCGSKNDSVEQNENVNDEPVAESQAVESVDEPASDSNADEESKEDIMVDEFTSSVTLSDEMFEAFATEGWQTGYKSILDGMYEGNEFKSEDILFAEYYLYDIDKDDIPEMILKQGVDENHYISEVFYWDGEGVQLAGEIYLGRSALYSYPEENGVITYYLHMGTGIANRVRLLDGQAVYDEEDLFYDDMMERYVMDLEPDPVEVADVIPGAEVVHYYCPNYTYPLLDYVGNAYASGREQLSDSEFEDMVKKVLDNEEAFYWIPTENYFLNDYDFRTDKVTLDYLEGAKGLFYNDTGYVKNTWFEDFNGDGMTECLVEMRGEELNSTKLALFTYQHENMYAYTIMYAGDWSIEVVDGHIYASGIYDGGMELSFQYMLDQSKSFITHNDHVILSENAAQDLADFRKELNDNDNKLAVAFIGCSGNYSGEYLIDVYKDASEEFADYAFMKELGKNHVVKQPGEEVYVLVPAKDNYIINIYEKDWGNFDMDVYPKRGELLYQGEPGEIVVVRCNQSDIMSNVEVSMDMDGTEFVYEPQMSLEDGSLSTIPGVYDFGKMNSF